VIGASSRDQATILFQQAAGLVERSGLAGMFDVKGGYRHIRANGGRIRVLAADAKTADGVIPTLALVDELHRHPSAELYGVFSDGLDARDGTMLTISTAGANLTSPLGLLRTKAHELENFHRIEARKYNHAKSPDGSFVLHEWCLSASDDVEDVSVVKRANPASWQTLKKLKSRRERPGMTPARWLRFACNIWTEAEDPAFETKQWDDLKVDGLSIAPKAPVVLCVKRRSAVASIVAVHRGEEFLDAEAFIWEESAELKEIEAKVRELCERWSVEQVLYDPWTFKRSAEILEEEGFPMFDFPNSLERMSQASTSLQGVIEAKQLRHGGDMVFRSQVLAATWKESERGRRLVEDPSSRHPIDAALALASAVHVAGAPQKTGEVLVAWV